MAHTSRRDGPENIRCTSDTCLCQSDPNCREPILGSGGGVSQPVKKEQIAWRGKVNPYRK